MTAPSPERARLAAALRELKARTGLSLVGLAAKTAFSKSSWDRYLNGRTLPPRDAVQDLCRLAGEPEGRCLALWEIAEAQWSGRAAPPRPPRASPAARAAPTSPSARASPSASVAASPCTSSSAASAAVPAAPSAREVRGAGGAGDDGAVQRSAAALAVLASVCAAVAVGVAAVALLLPHGDGGPRWSLSPPAAGPRCREAACEGESPMRMKCASAPVTLASHRTAGGASLELRYSEECGTSWARMWGTRVGDRVELAAAGLEGRDSRSGPGGRVRSAEVRNAVDADAYVYTPMAAVEPGAVVRACFRPAAGEGECFGGRVTR